MEIGYQVPALDFQEVSTSDPLPLPEGNCPQRVIVRGPTDYISTGQEYPVGSLESSGDNLAIESVAHLALPVYQEAIALSAGMFTCLDQEQAGHRPSGFGIVVSRREPNTQDFRSRLDGTGCEPALPFLLGVVGLTPGRQDQVSAETQTVIRPMGLPEELPRFAVQGREPRLVRHIDSIGVGKDVRGPGQAEVPFQVCGPHGPASGVPPDHLVRLVMDFDI
jgi:hypothetical protein